jgi:hypothetical protein
MEIIFNLYIIPFLKKDCSKGKTKYLRAEGDGRR